MLAAALPSAAQAGAARSIASNSAIARITLMPAADGPAIRRFSS
jgi:hypothetical protein